MPKDDELTFASVGPSGIVHYNRCWSCVYGQHYEPTPRWHTWADDEDIEHAMKTDQPDPSKSRCACECADGA